MRGLRGSLLGGTAILSGLLAPLALGAPAATADAPRPEFSWDTIPTWCVARNRIAFTDEDIAALARHPVVMLEKATGHETFGNVESGAREAARRIKAINARAMIFFYWNAVIEYPGYAANREFDEHADEWALKKDGQIYQFKKRYKILDPRVPAMREWWTRTAADMARDPAIDGVFIDAICKTNSPNVIYPEPGIADACLQMGRELRQAVGPGKLLMGNALRFIHPNGNRQHLEYLDGSYLERWHMKEAGSPAVPDIIAGSIELMQEALAGGKIILLASGPHEQATEMEPPSGADRARARPDALREGIQFPLAVFLIAAERHAYFNYKSGVDAHPSSGDVWRMDDYAELKRPLGRPLAKATRAGYVFTRSYEHVDVWVDVEKQQARLEWKTAE